MRDVFAVGERVPEAEDWIEHLRRPNEPVPWFRPKREAAFPDDVLEADRGDFVAYLRRRSNDDWLLCDAHATCTGTVFCKGGRSSGASMVFCEADGPTYQVDWLWYHWRAPIGCAKDFRSGIEIGRFDHAARRPHQRFIERRDGRVITQQRQQLFDFHGGCVRVHFTADDQRVAVSSSLRPSSSRRRSPFGEAGAVIFSPDCPAIDRQLIVAQVLQPSFIEWNDD